MMIIIVYGRRSTEMMFQKLNNNKIFDTWGMTDVNYENKERKGSQKFMNLFLKNKTSIT